MLQDDIYEITTKFGVSIMSAVTALMAKISNEIMNKRDLNGWQWLALVCISLFWSWMAGLFCYWQGYDSIYSSLIIGLFTLLGEKVNIYISHNYKKIFEKFLSIFTDNKK